VTLLVLGLVLVLQSAPQKAAETVPEVALRYSPVFDGQCSELTNSEIPPAWVETLNAKLDRFQAYWNQEGSRLLGAALEIVGKPYPHREMIATLTLCRFRSMSLPLILNMRFFLEEASQSDGRKALPLEHFPGLVFHELLHTYLFEHRYWENSILLSKYGKEAFLVKVHLHLMALMRAAYERLGLSADIKAIAEWEKSLNPSLKRAWEIVEAEGYRPLVRELQSGSADK